MQKVCFARVSTACGVLVMTVVIGFHCDVISCELARRGVQRGAAESSTYGHGNAVGLTSMEGSLSSMVIIDLVCELQQRKMYCSYKLI